MEGKKRKVSDANFDPDGTESFRDDERRPVFSSAKALEERETRSGPGLPIDRNAWWFDLGYEMI